ncbi:DUF1304 domain-containing protein [Allorhizobium taibaishanense]|uniref:Putative membrane protein n=1 Tax=Allorhizobium taibaishanense TaxID=887144 RepID=A0A7W6HKS0_9HYPH|nr:DUF1304 domain-containing protein [Allorhizobium taibaishanense]MBB4007057.1 putative membrane protein [Allorhizobium taibaishanense]
MTISVIATIAVALVMLEHVYILALEMFLWTTPRSRRIFRKSLQGAEMTRVMAANQGLYNGFLAAGLFWGLVHPQPGVALQLQVFFLGAVVLAGLYGGKTVSRKIFFAQAAPAATALVLVLFSG